MANLSTALKSLPANRTTASAVKALSKLGVNTMEDLLFYFPYRYLDFSKFSKIAEAKPGETITIRAKIKSIQARFSFKTRRSLCEAVVSDDSGSLKVTWFNQGYLAKSLKVGQEVLLSGRIEQYKGVQMINPIHELVSEESIHTGRIVPIYHITEGLYHRTLRSLVKSQLGLAEELTDILPDEVKKQNNLPELADAVKAMHFPESEAQLNKAKVRVIFEEVFIEQLAVGIHKKTLEKLSAPKVPQNITLIKEFLSELPFELTAGQKKALWEIIQDLEKPHPMNRLLEGDTGSGKTLVAIGAALETVNAGFQVAVLAPTEILAKQHYDTFRHQLEGNNIKVGLLTGHFHQAGGADLPKPKLLKNIAENKTSIIIGTHALLQGGVKFGSLGLLIIDEQHRFGVEQRSFLIKNSKQAETFSPHLLSMSATPIPRTLALAFYGDLEISTLNQLPKNRQAVTTSIIPEAKRAAAYDFIKKEIVSGRQGFIVTPRVEESETGKVKSAKSEMQRLHKEVFSNFRLGLIHGKMKGSEKEKIMAQFYNKELDILVATSVIEIGIDVPNATIMMIEGAENFGLAQLHQLRGRVGRGEHKSYCLLFTDATEDKSLERLKIFSQTTDGFKLAELDLKTRGFGSLFGSEQTGFNFRFSEYLTIEVLEMAKKSAAFIIQKDPGLSGYLELKKRTAPLVEKIHLE